MSEMPASTCLWISCHPRPSCEPINTGTTVIGLKLSPNSLITLAIIPTTSQLTSKLNGVNSNYFICETCVRSMNKNVDGVGILQFSKGMH